MSSLLENVRRLVEKTESYNRAKKEREEAEKDVLRSYPFSHNPDVSEAYDLGDGRIALVSKLGEHKAHIETTESRLSMVVKILHKN